MSIEFLELWRQLVSMWQWNQLFGVDLFSSFNCHNLCFDLFILVLTLEFACFFSAHNLSFQLFARKHCLQVLELKMYSFTWNRFPIFKNIAIDSLLAFNVESTYLNTDISKFESSQKDESRAMSADSLKAYWKPKAINYRKDMCSFKNMWNIASRKTHSAQRCNWYSRD